MNREISPLKKADDAEVVDTSEINPQQVSEKIIELFEKKIAD
jgi:cytidylate kinase